MVQLVDMFENISGSAELKEEYDAALKAKEEAEQATIFAFNKTKEHKSERRVLKEQKVGNLYDYHPSLREIPVNVNLNE